MDNRIIICYDILEYLTLNEMKTIIKTKKNHTMDDFRILCYASHGVLFPFFSKSIFIQDEFIKCAIKNCCQGKTLIRFLPKKMGINFWNKNYSENYQEYVNCMDISINTNDLIPDHLTYILNDFGISYLSLKKNGCRIKQIPNHLKQNKLLLSTALMQNGNSLMYVPSFIKCNKEYKRLICLCISKFPYALQYAGKICRSDPIVINCAMSKVKWIKRYILNN